jgi:hypothetical protein
MKISRTATMTMTSTRMGEKSGRVGGEVMELLV